MHRITFQSPRESFFSSLLDRMDQRTSERPATQRDTMHQPAATKLSITIETDDDLPQPLQMAGTPRCPRRFDGPT